MLEDVRISTADRFRKIVELSAAHGAPGGRQWGKPAGRGNREDSVAAAAWEVQQIEERQTEAHRTPEADSETLGESA